MKDPFAKKRKLRLRPLQVPGIDGPLEVDGGELRFGRAEDNDVVLPAETFPSVSGHHLRIARDSNGAFVVEDLGSRNGTLVNGKRVETQPLRAGDIVQLGTVGPRFMVVSGSPLSETMFVDPKRHKVSESEVLDLVRRRARLHTLRLAGLGLVLFAALAWWMFDRSEAVRRQSEQESALARELVARLRRESEEQARIAMRQEAQRSAYIAALEEQMRGSERELETLRSQLAAIEKGGASAQEIARLEQDLSDTRKDLADARQRLARVDPVNLEANRLTEVARVRAAVVEIEASLSFEKEGAPLFFDAEKGPNWDGIGEPWVIESTGSGFAISPEGYILTNRHVVEPEEEELVTGAREQGIRPILHLHAVFDGETQRHSLEVVRIADGADLALAKIDPYPGMPYVEGFSTALEPPPEGSDVYLLGFPLGNFALQEGPRVQASTFRGILSRIVDGNLQVDAGVHPGNSGGPITDPEGHVIGVVFSVQATPEQTAVYTIGYGIPIARAGEIWPPQSEK